jgi:hypothetical protein
MGSAVSDYVPNAIDGVAVYDTFPGTVVPQLTASAAITGGQVLVISGAGTVAPSGGASGLIAGVAASDVSSGQKVLVWPIGPGIVHTSITPAGVAAGASIASAAAGGVDSGTLGTLAAAGTLLGTTLTTASVGQPCRWIGR